MQQAVMTEKQLNRFEESLLPRHQIIRMKTKDGNKDMGCRFKDWIYLASIILVGTGVWYTYFKPRQELGEPWPWAENSADTSRDLLHHPDNGEEYYIDDVDDNGNLGNGDDDDEEFTVYTDADDAFKDYNFDGSDVAKINEKELSLYGNEGSNVEHHAENKFNVPYNQELIELRDPESGNDESLDNEFPLDSDVNSHMYIESPQTDSKQKGFNGHEKENDSRIKIIDTPSVNLLAENIPSGLNLTAVQSSVLISKTDSETVEIQFDDAAGAILRNHTDKAQQLGIVPNSNVRIVSDESNSARLEVVEKYKPRIVLRSADFRQTRDEKSEEPKIPRIIHQSWETTNIPLEFVPWVQSWLQTNPGWEYWFWTNDDVNALIYKSYPSFSKIFESGTLSLINRANIMRYFIVHAHGGVFAELDMECLKSMDSWIFSHGCFLVEEAREHSYLVHNKLQGSVINAIMACKPHHPFYEVILRALPDYLTRYAIDPARASGSFFLDDIYRAFKKHPLPSSLSSYGDVAMIEPDYFIPSYDERHWQDIDKACNTNIGSMPFHVSWLCTLWLRKRMHENEPYKHSYTNHHWIDPTELREGNVSFVDILAVIQNAIPGTEIQGFQTSSSQEAVRPLQSLQQYHQSAQPQEPQNLPLAPQDLHQQMPLNQLPQQRQDIPVMPQDFHHQTPLHQYPQQPQDMVVMPQDINQEIPIHLYPPPQQDIPVMPQALHQQMPLHQLPQQSQDIPLMPQDIYQQIPQQPHQQETLQQQQPDIPLTIPQQPQIGNEIPVIPQEFPQELLDEPQSSQHPIQTNTYGLQEILKPQNYDARVADDELGGNNAVPHTPLDKYSALPQFPISSADTNPGDSDKLLPQSDYNKGVDYPSYKGNMESFNSNLSYGVQNYNTNNMIPMENSDKTENALPVAQYDANSILQNAIDFIEPAAVNSNKPNLYDVLKQRIHDNTLSGLDTSQNISPERINVHGSFGDSEYVDTKILSQHDSRSQYNQFGNMEQYSKQDGNNA